MKKSYIIIYFISIVSIGSSGFYYIGRPEWSILDSIYMTIITLATVGYGEVHHMSQAARIWAILVIVFGVTGIGAVLRVFGQELIQIELYKKRIMMNKIKEISEHFIICGYGRMGAVIAKEFSEKKLKFLVIERDNKKADILKNKGILVIHNDATDEDALKSANFKSALGAAVVLNNDRDNLFVTLSIRTYNPDIHIISRCAREENKNKLIRAGANRVINPYVSGGHRMAEILSSPKLEDSLSIKAPNIGNLDISVNEISMKNLDYYIGSKISEINLSGNYGIDIVGIIKGSGSYIINPDKKTILNKEDIIIIMGETSKFALFLKKASSSHFVP